MGTLGSVRQGRLERGVEVCPGHLGHLGPVWWRRVFLGAELSNRGTNIQILQEVW